VCGADGFCCFILGGPIAWIAAWIHDESKRVTETIKARLVEWVRNRQQENCIVLIIR